MVDDNMILGTVAITHESGRIPTDILGEADKNFKGSAPAADPPVGQVRPGGGYDPPEANFGGSTLGSLGVFRPWNLEKEIPQKK